MNPGRFSHEVAELTNVAISTAAVMGAKKSSDFRPVSVLSQLSLPLDHHYCPIRFKIELWLESISTFEAIKVLMRKRNP